MKSLFEGTAVAIVTPFKNGKVDFDAFEKIINSDIEKGVKAIVVLGTTGEGVSVTLEEREKIIKFARAVIGGRVKLIVGTGHNNFVSCQENTIMAKSSGAAGVLVVTPYYNKTTQDGLVEYYSQLCEIGIPIIMYNVPSRTGLNIDIKTVEKLLNLKMIYGLKESSCDINRIIELSRICKDKIALYSGEDALNYVFYCLGAQGCVSVTANVVADKVESVYQAVKSGDYVKGLSIQNELHDINMAMFVETNPIPVKAFMEKLDLIDSEVRMPLVKSNNTTQSLLTRLVQKLQSDEKTL